MNTTRKKQNKNYFSRSRWTSEIPAIDNDGFVLLGKQVQCRKCYNLCPPNFAIRVICWKPVDSAKLIQYFGHYRCLSTMCRWRKYQQCGPLSVLVTSKRELTTAKTILSMKYHRWQTAVFYKMTFSDRRKTNNNKFRKIIGHDFFVGLLLHANKMCCCLQDVRIRIISYSVVIYDKMEANCIMTLLSLATARKNWCHANTQSFHVMNKQSARKYCST